MLWSLLFKYTYSPTPPQVVSEDPIAVSLARKHKVDIVISSSGLDTLLNNQPPDYGRQWQLPVSVQRVEGLYKTEVQHLRITANNWFLGCRDTKNLESLESLKDAYEMFWRLNSEQLVYFVKLFFISNKMCAVIVIGSKHSVVFPTRHIR